MRVLTLILALFVLSLIFSTKVSAKPDRSSNEKTENTIPNLSGQSNWGVVTQTGHAIQINGHASWFAVGNIRKDGKVFLVWTLVNGERAGLGVYTIDKDDPENWSISGHWGWGDEVSLDNDGNLQGHLMIDRTYKLKEENTSPDIK